MADIENLFTAEAKFSKTQVHSILKYPIKKENPTHPVCKGMSLYSAWETLAQGLHRLPVLDQEGQVVDVVTQSMLIDFLWQNIERVGKISERPVAEIIGSCPVQAVHERTKAIVAFREMSAHNLSGIAVVDDSGVLIDNLSLRDLKGIHSDAKIFWRLWNTVKDFKTKMRQDYPSSVGPKPICVTKDDKLYTVIEKMALNHIHRIYVVDSHESMLPERIISQTDVLQQVLKDMRKVDAGGVFDEKKEEKGNKEEIEIEKEKEKE
eukprot:TRINITY_DN3419_c0_g1_i3.p1 TRINITY_DN3419_c0_g1~~TRINITY_DN3419_c0_g1_i3.p1  ORF type:complete len:264 (-),score=54.56 TRINITY_DN3419_c0_g1_i3:52-843(-)